MRDDEGDDGLRDGSLRELAKYVDEFLFGQLAGSRLDDALSRCFWDTIAVSGPRRVGTWIDARLGELGVTQEATAERLNVHRTAVTKWINKGSISLIKFLGLFIRFKVDGQFSRLVDDIRVEGYVGAIAHVQDVLKARADGGPAGPDQARPTLRRWPWLAQGRPPGGRSPTPQLDHDHYWCLALLFASDSISEWADAQASRDLPRLEAITDRIRERLRLRLGRHPRLGPARDLEDLVQEWGMPWLICHRIIDEGLFA